MEHYIFIIRTLLLFYLLFKKLLLINLITFYKSNSLTICNCMLLVLLISSVKPYKCISFISFYIKS